MRIELAGISKVYGRKRVLDQIRLEVPAGRIVAVVGLNGAGKSTLLHCLAGLLCLSEGEVFFDDTPFSRESAEQSRRFAFLPDFPIMFSTMTPLEHIGMVLRLYEKDGEGAENRVLELLRHFDLMPLANTPVQALSRGQIYKVALTALIAAEPELWLLDEPMASGMDALGLREFRGAARTAAEAGATGI